MTEQGTIIQLLHKSLCRNFLPCNNKKKSYKSTIIPQHKCDIHANIFDAVLITKIPFPAELHIWDKRSLKKKKNGFFGILCFPLVSIWSLYEPNSFISSYLGKESEVTQLCLTLCDSMDCSLSGSSIRGILQARILEWIAISFSRGSSQPKEWTHVFLIAGRLFTLWATSENPSYLEKHWNPSQWPLFLMTSKKFHETSRNLLEKYVLDCMYSPFTKITYVLTFPPCLFRAVSQSYLRCCLLGRSPHFAPHKT